MTTRTKRKPLSHPFKVEPETKDESVAEAIDLSEPDARPAPLPWLTWETVLWAAVIILAVSLRLWHLGLYPLSNAEATQGLAALQLYRGGQPEADAYSPLLLSLNSLSFLLFGASDASARLAGVLLGSVLVLLPLTLRDRLGPLVCLLAAALLAISPTAIFLSRTVNSEIGVAVGSLMIVAGFFNWTATTQKWWLLLMAGGLAVLLTAGPTAFSVLLAFALIVLIRRSVFKALWNRTLDSSERPVTEPNEHRRDEVAASAVKAAESETDSRTEPAPQHRPEPESGADSIVESAPPDFSLDPRLRQAGIFFGVALVLLATTALFNLSGLSVLGNSLPEWLGRFRFELRPEAGFNAVFLLTIYEPLLVGAGLVGLAYALLRWNDLLAMTLSVWFLGLLMVDLVMAGRPNANVIILLTPLAFLAALALARLVESLRERGSWGNEGLLLATGLVIFGFTYISLTGWLDRVCGPEDRLCQLAWLQPVAAVLLFVVVLVFFWLITEPDAVGRGAALVGLALGLLFALNQGWRLNYGPLMNLAYQPLAGVPASPELVLLTDTLAFESAKRVGDPTLLDTALVGSTGAALPWRLRDYRHLSHVNSAGEVPAGASAVITPATVESLGLTEPYVGQDFAADAIWSPVGLPFKDFLKWLIYREVNQLPLANKVVLWLTVES